MKLELLILKLKEDSKNYTYNPEEIKKLPIKSTQWMNIHFKSIWTKFVYKIND